MDINFENIKKLYNKFWRDLSDYIIFLKNPKKYFDIIVNEPLKQNIKRLVSYIFFVLLFITIFRWFSFGDVNFNNIYKLPGKIIINFIKFILFTPIFVLILKLNKVENKFKISINYIVLQSVFTAFPFYFLEELFYLTEVYEFYYLSIIFYFIFLIFYLGYLPWIYSNSKVKLIYGLILTIFLFVVVNSGVQEVILNAEHPLEDRANLIIFQNNDLADIIANEFINDAYPLLLETGNIAMYLNEYIANLNILLLAEKDKFSYEEKLIGDIDYYRMDQLIRNWNLDKSKYIKELERINKKAINNIKKSNFSITKQCLKDVRDYTDDILLVTNKFDKFLNQNSEKLITHNMLTYKKFLNENPDKFENLNKIFGKIFNEQIKVENVSYNKIREQINEFFEDNKNVAVSKKVYINSLEEIDNEGKRLVENMYLLKTTNEFSKKGVNLLSNNIEKHQKYYNYSQFIYDLAKRLPFYFIVNTK